MAPPRGDGTVPDAVETVYRGREFHYGHPQAGIFCAISPDRAGSGSCSTARLAPSR